MNIKLVNTKLDNLNLYKNQKLEIDFFAEKRVSAEERETFVVSNLFNSIYKFNNIAFVGKNASGKTITLGIISDILNIYINNKSLSEVENLNNFFNSTLKIENILTDGKTLYKIKSTIEKNHLGELYFSEETLYEIKIKTSLSKIGIKTIFDDVEGQKRNKLNNPYLKKEDTMFSSILNMYRIPSLYVRDLGGITNFNFPIYFSSQMPLSFVNYLDSSIEKFKMIERPDDSKATPLRDKYLIKFKDSDKEIVANEMQLENYLSSGTIKGINILINARLVLMCGGYLLIDEIENHLNKSIVINLINLFTSDINQKGATLLFTTHYSEILDSISRSDNIYVLDKKDKITVSKFSSEARGKDRSDKKKSDLILSGSVGTSPSYLSYRKLKEDLRKVILKGDN